MNLLQIRQWLVKESGRYELVIDTTDWADNGADNYIYAGQRLLDDLQNTTHTSGTNMQRLVSGNRHVLFGACKSVQQVFVIDPTTDKKWELDREIRTYPRQYANTDDVYPEVDLGPPVTYEAVNMRAAPEAEMTGDIDVPADYMQFVEAPHLYNGLLFYPVADQDYIIETHGQFYSPQLMLDEDENYWSLRYPHALVMAAQCVMEMFSRNTEGVKDWMGSLKIILDGIDRNLVADEIAYITKMEG